MSYNIPRLKEHERLLIFQTINTLRQHYALIVTAGLNFTQTRYTREFVEDVSNAV
jgi:hypothetical protein